MKMAFIVCRAPVAAWITPMKVAFIVCVTPVATWITPAPHAPARFISKPLGAIDPDYEPCAALHTLGFTVLPGRTLLPPETLTAICASTPYSGIFDGNKPDERPTRLQGRSPLWAPAMEQLLADRLRPHGLLACSRPGEEKVVNDVYALKSVARPHMRPETAAVLGRQPVHSDAPEPLAADGCAVAAVSELADEDMPLSCLLAVMPDTVRCLRRWRPITNCGPCAALHCG